LKQLKGDKIALDVLVSNGNSHLGGQDFDNLLVEYCAEKFEAEHYIDIRGDKIAMNRLKNECE